MRLNMVKAISPEGITVVWTGQIRANYTESYTQVLKTIDDKEYLVARIPGNWLVAFEDNKVEKPADKLTGTGAIEYTVANLKKATHYQLEALKAKLKNYNARSGYWKE
jgi:hypothetical protein